MIRNKFNGEIYSDFIVLTAPPLCRAVSYEYPSWGYFSVSATITFLSDNENEFGFSNASPHISKVFFEERRSALTARVRFIAGFIVDS